MTSPRRRRRTQDGQALIEFGMVIFAVIALTLLAIGVSILSAARAEVDGAVQMSALGAASVPAHVQIPMPASQCVAACCMVSHCGAGCLPATITLIRS